MHQPVEAKKASVGSGLSGFFGRGASKLHKQQKHQNLGFEPIELLAPSTVGRPSMMTGHFYDRHGGGGAEYGTSTVASASVFSQPLSSPPASTRPVHGTLNMNTPYDKSTSALPGASNGGAPSMLSSNYAASVAGTLDSGGHPESTTATRSWGFAGSTLSSTIEGTITGGGHKTRPHPGHRIARKAVASSSNPGGLSSGGLSSSSITLPATQPAYSQDRVTDADVRKVVSLLRDMYVLDLAVWSLRHAVDDDDDEENGARAPGGGGGDENGTDQELHMTVTERRIADMQRADDMLVEVRRMVRGWGKGGPGEDALNRWTYEERDELRKIEELLAVGDGEGQVPERRYKHEIDMLRAQMCA